MKINNIIACIAIAAFSISCGKEEHSTIVTGTTDSDIPASFIAAEAPDGAISIVEARASAKPGEPIVLRGKVGGKYKPISEAAAILVLADEGSIKSCDQTEDDECETPWDYCCEDLDKIAASIATIQVKGDDGQLLRSTLRGFADLKELSHLVIAGTVDEASTPEALIINANQIHVEKP